MARMGSQGVPNAVSAFGGSKVESHTLVNGVNAVGFSTIACAGSGRVGFSLVQTSEVRPLALPGTIQITTVMGDGNPNSVAQFFAFGRKSIDSFYLLAMSDFDWVNDEFGGNYDTVYREHQAYGSFFGVYVDIQRAQDDAVFGFDLTLYATTG